VFLIGNPRELQFRRFGLFCRFADLPVQQMGVILFFRRRRHAPVRVPAELRSRPVFHNAVADHQHLANLFRPDSAAEQNRRQKQCNPFHLSYLS